MRVSLFSLSFLRRCPDHIGGLLAHSFLLTGIVHALHSLSGSIDQTIERTRKSPIASSRHRTAIASHPRTHTLPDSRTRHSHAPRAYTAHTSTRVSDTTTHPTARGREYAAQLHICIYMRSFHCIDRVEQTRSVGVPATTMSTLDTHYLYANTPCDR